MKYGKITWHISNYDEKRATGDDYRKKVFLGFLEGKKHYSIGRGSKYWNQRPPRNEAWDYE